MFLSNFTLEFGKMCGVKKIPVRLELRVPFWIQSLHRFYIVLHRIPKYYHAKCAKALFASAIL